LSSRGRRFWLVRVLLDKQLPLDLAAMLEGHAATTVTGRGWAGVKNGDLLRRMRGEYDALLTMDQGIEFQDSGPVKSAASADNAGGERWRANAH